MLNSTEVDNLNLFNNPNEQQIDIVLQNNETILSGGSMEVSSIDSKQNDNNMHKFYNFPKYYDKAFTRDIKSDIIFFKNCFQQYSDIKVTRVLEPACGPGMFLEMLPKYGFYVLGYDLNSAMVEYAKEKLRVSGITIEQADIVEGNMKDMRFDNKFDAAFICINSLGYLRSNEEISSHFKAMSESLKIGSVYIVEISCKCDDIMNEKRYDDTWYVREENLELELTWAINWYNLEHRIRHVDFRMVIKDNGNELLIEEAHELRLWIFDEFKHFANSSGFEIVGIYNQNYEGICESTPITGELGALFFILKKVASSED